MEDSSSHIYANIMQDPAGKQMEGSSFQMLQLVSQMEGSSCKMLQVACEKESSNYKMPQVVCKWKVLALCKMNSSSSKMLQMIANDCKWLQMARKSGRFQLPSAANSMENWHGQESKKH